MDYREEQEGEIEALRSIYTEDEFKELSSDPWSFQISVKAELNHLTAECTVQFDLPDQYPDQPPSFSVVSLSSNIPSELIDQILEQQSQDNIGMPMIFTIMSVLQETLQEQLEQSQEEETKLIRQREEEERRKEEEKYRGTIVTVETFAEWKRAFMEERGREKVNRIVTGKLTGREMFERDASLALSDVQFLTAEGDEDITLPDDVEVDESLFQDLGDLDDDEDCIS